jgi:uncharacterized Zn finger protein (UPF0148 family)
MKYEPFDLYDSIETECTITCSNCGRQSSVHGIESDNAADVYFDEGWRATKNGNVYCPKCAKKKLKQK